MSRYRYTKIKRDSDSNRVYGLTIYPQVPIQDGDLFVYPVDGDRLENVAYRYYNDTSLWWIIAEANNIKGGRFALDPNVELRIPINIEPILLEFRNVNSTGTTGTSGGGGGY